MSEYYDPKTYPTQWNYLQTGTVVDDYIIERELARGGFSSVYLARQRSDQVQVAIKEYLPRKLAHRTWNNEVVANDEESKKLFARGRVLFIEEAKILTILKHPNIVEVINFFQANSTVYLVMTYDYGITLDKILKAKEVKVTESWLMDIFGSLLTGLKLIHEHNILHLDVKPGNLLIRPDNDALLLDFGAIQPYPLDKSKCKTYILTKGFSPIEQYSATGVLGPYSDIYAVGASMRACLDFDVPPQAPDRVANDAFPLAQKAYAKKLNKRFLEIIDWAMEVMPANRPQTVQELQDALANM
ncbi:MAG: serine/threonine protein kinase [Methylococcaceae bacterium]|nr:serine/threonine protein kinase [Methylococcaceae bacterium]